MTDFKTIKHFKCSLDFNLTHLLTVWVMSSSNVFLKGVIFFPFFTNGLTIDVESASNYAAGEHRILTTMDISGSVISTLWLFCVFPLHRSHIYRSSKNHLKIEGRVSSKCEQLYRRTRTPSWLLSLSEVIRILMRVIRLTNRKPCRCYNTCGYIIFMTWVISMDNLTVMW